MAKATIIIPTYNRPKHLQRLLDYYHKYGKDFSIVVADSSSEENKELNREIISSLPNLNVQYIEYPKEINPYHKFTDMGNYAKEKYCVFCGDDDFIVPNAINQCIDFLEKNPDFKVVHGRYISFWLKPKKNKKKQFCWQVRYSNQSIDFPEPEKRLFKHLSDYGLPTVYGVQRTDFFKMIYRELLNSGIDVLLSSQLFGELLPSMLTLIYGKMKCLDNVIYMARQIDSEHNYRNDWPTLTDLVKQGKYDEEYSKFRKCLAIHLNKKSQIEIEKSKKLIDEAMSLHIKRYYSSDPKRVLINKLKHISDNLNTPDWLYKEIRLLYKKLFFPQQADDFFVSLDNPESFSKYYDDFEKIKNQVIKFYG